MYIHVWRNSQRVYTIVYDKDVRKGGRIVSVSSEKRIGRPSVWESFLLFLLGLVITLDFFF
jgi:hypothetical protein